MDLKHIKCFLLDMDGTFYLGSRPLEGSLEFIEALQQKNIDYLFLTNNSSKSARSYMKKLSGMGLVTDKVLTSGQVAAGCILERFGKRRVYLLGNDELKGEMREAGVNIVENNPQLVCIAFDTTLDYERLKKVCDFVRAGLPYIATHPDPNCPVEGGVLPDIGATIAFIKASTGREPDLIAGKPHREMIDAALKRTACKKEQCCMVGDRLLTDIATGKKHGITTALVLTGVTSLRDVEMSSIKPDIIVERLYDLIKLI